MPAPARGGCSTPIYSGGGSDIVSYQMADILIRDIPDDVVNGLDARAKHFGLSHTEFLRRTLKREASIHPGRKTTIEDLRWFAETFQDLKDEEIMRRAWE